MIKRVAPHLFVGDTEDCRGYMPTVHACKYPCFKQIGYTRSYTLEVGDHLYLNMIDPPKPLFVMELFEHFFKYMGDHKDRDVLIHCNQGMSRSPTLALLHMVRQGTLEADNYTQAKNNFRDIYPKYNPGLGIQTYMDMHWQELICV